MLVMDGRFALGESCTNGIVNPHNVGEMVPTPRALQWLLLASLLQKSNQRRASRLKVAKQVGKSLSVSQYFRRRQRERNIHRR